MKNHLSADEVIETLRDATSRVEALQRILMIVSPLEMDQSEALRELRIRCADSIEAVQMWKRKSSS